MECENNRAPVANKSRLIVRSKEPLNLETPVHLLTDPLTPTDLFFVRVHGRVPDIDGERWRLAIGGLVERHVELSLDGLRQYPLVSCDATLECSGNGRTLFPSPPEGVAWERGAIGTARWTGVRLRELLAQAGVLPGAAHMRVVTAEAPLDGLPPFVRSLPLSRAMADSTLVAFLMNGQPLPVEHGFPARLVVSGWSGQHWVKWITALELVAREETGYYMQQEYRVSDGADGSSELIAGPAVKSVIASPAEGSVLPRVTSRVEGFAFAGERAVISVDLSVDGGASWHAAGSAGTGHGSPPPPDPTRFARVRQTRRVPNSRCDRRATRAGICGTGSMWCGCGWRSSRLA
jgi:sulfite oxidase